MRARNYLEMAVDMALSLGEFHSDPICLLCDRPILEIVQARFPDVFDDLVLIETELDHPLAANFLLSELAPYERGLYIDADVIVLGRLDPWIEETKSKPIAMMGKYLEHGSGERHHDVLIDALLDAFDVPTFFKNHSGALGYQREAAAPFFRKSHAIYRRLHREKFRGVTLRKAWIGNELAFGVAASGLHIDKMATPYPVYWGHEMLTLDLQAPFRKPLLHFMAPPPPHVLDRVLADVAERRATWGFDVISDEIWRKKAARSQQVSRLKDLANSTRGRLRQLRSSMGHKTTAKSSSADQKPNQGTRKMSVLDLPDMKHREVSQKLYFHHLMKCGGTSLIAWLLTHYPDYGPAQRVIQDDAYGKHVDQRVHPLRNRMKQRSFAVGALNRLGCVVDHAPLAALVPDGTLRITCLRDPRARLVSQCDDWKSQTPDEINRLPEPLRKNTKLLHDTTLKEFLETVGRQGETPYHMVNNYMTRTFAETRIGPLASVKNDPAFLLPIALEVLDELFDTVGVLDDELAFRTAIAAKMGWCPPVEQPRLNVRKSRGETPADDVSDAADIIGELTKMDELLYAAACEKAKSSRQVAADWSYEAFESGAHEKLKRLQSTIREGHTVFSTSEPVFGSGFWGRLDGAVDDGLRINADQDVNLYVPTPERGEVDVALWFEGLAALSSQDDVKAFIDDTPVPFEVGPSSVAPLQISIRTRTNRPFVKVTLAFEGSNASLSLFLVSYGWKAV